MTGVLLFAGVLPDRIMRTPWFAALSMFVAVNTLLYLTMAIIKTLPKAYLSDWIDQRNRRSESRCIFPDVAAQPSGNGHSPAPCVTDAPATRSVPSSGS